VDTSSVVQISPPGRFFDPDWSPSGRQVAYRNSIGDTTGIWISPVDGSRSKEYFVRGGTPQWFPNGQKLLYTCNGLCIKQIDQSSQQRIFSFPENDEFHTLRGAAVSPAGERVVMGAKISGDSQIRTMNADGSNQRTLTTIEDQWWSAGQPDWSPDGERIVYIGPEHTIWVMDADGSNKEQLTTRPEGPVGWEESS
jgi:Tol biopolymer transport system component